MSTVEFLKNVKTAHNLYVHGAQADHSIWLTPLAFKGFDVRDFSHLDAEVQNQLRDNVQRFVHIAKQVPPTKLPTPAQLVEAKRAFLKVLDILGPYISDANGSELKQIRDALKGVNFPGDVLTWDYELGTDSTGDPAVWVWVFVDDLAAKREGFTQTAEEVRWKIRDAFLAAGIERWPYVRFRTASEQRAL